MSFQTEKRESIKRYMLCKVREDDGQFVQKTAENFVVSATSVKRYLKECLDKNIVIADQGKACGYSLLTVEKEWSYQIDPFLMEDSVYYKDIVQYLDDISNECMHIWAYAFMEIMNNAIEHSGGTKIYCSLKRDFLYTEISITDNGVGIFRNIQNYMEKRWSRKMDFEDVRIELYKGRLTTDSLRHSGEGIFFVSKMLDSFAIWSGNTIFSLHCAEREKFVKSHLLSYDSKVNDIGTLAVMRLCNDTKKTTKEVFDMFAPIEEGFVKTYIPIREVCPHGEPIARSQARRILYRLENFQEVEFDFAQVEFMGQGFADEIFRVFHNAHPEVALTYLNAEPSVSAMIKHVTAGNK